jgi:hypothetical protein
MGTKKTQLLTLTSICVCAVLALEAGAALVVSTGKTANISGTTFGNGSLFEVTGNLVFAEGLFAANENIDAAAMLDNGHIVLSTTSKAKLGGLTFRNGTLINYNPVTDTAKVLLAESVFRHNENIDAVHILDDGDILLSTSGKSRIGGRRFRDGDVIRYDPTTGKANKFFSESLFYKNGKRRGRRNVDIDGLHVLPNGNLLLSTRGRATLGGLRFRSGDVVEYNMATGQASLVYGNGLNIDAIALPAPATITLLGFGAAILLSTRLAKG